MSPEYLAPQKCYQEVGAFLEKHNESKDSSYSLGGNVNYGEQYEGSLKSLK